MSEPTDPKRTALQPAPRIDGGAEVDPDAPASAEELAAAEALRDALAGAPPEAAPDPTAADAELLRALSLADAPRELPKERAEALVATALDGFDARRSAKRTERRGVVVRVAFGAATLVAAAAAVVLFVGRPGSPPDTNASASLAHARSTQPLFNEPFERGQTSARADRIASARASDLRNNRFAQWGVR